LPAPGVVAAVLSRESVASRIPAALPADEMAEPEAAQHPQPVASLGRAMFLDHYVSIEVIGMLLLVAVIGAVLIASRSAPAATVQPASPAEAPR
jgi:NADH:ubiquinone oxidoreductase subunit 6 (subunit J)